MRFGDAPVMAVRSALMARRFLRARRGAFVADRDSRIFCANGAPVLRAFASESLEGDGCALAQASR